MPAQAAVGQDPVVNEVRLIGRVSQEPVERELPSGDVIRVFRVVVPRPVARSRDAPPRAQVDAVDCVAGTARMRRAAGSWRVDDVVEVSGALRRRFFRAGGRSVSRFEVEVTGGRLVRRAAPPATKAPSPEVGRAE